MAANLHVAFFEHVQEAHLDALGEVRQFVDGEDAAVDARQQAEMQRQLVVQIAALGHFDGVHLADQIGDGDVRRGQLLAVALRARQPGDGGIVAGFGDEGAALGAHRLKGILGNLRVVQNRRLGVEQLGEAAHDARLRLAALAEQHDVLAAENGVDDLRHHRLVVADDARKQRLAGAQLGDEVAAHLHLHGQHSNARGLEFAQRLGFGHHSIRRRCSPSVA